MTNVSRVRPPLKLATSAIVDMESGEVTIDGKPFEFYLADEPIVTRIDHSAIVVTLNVIVDGEVLLRGNK